MIFAGEKVREDHLLPASEVSESILIDGHTIVQLESLVRMKLNSFRRKDQMHLIDMLDVELIDETWPSRFPIELAERLQLLIDNPEG